MSQPIHPNHGARFQFERLQVEDSSAVYRVQIFVEDGYYLENARLSSDSKEVEWEEGISPQPPAETMPAWMRTHAEALMRQIRQGFQRNGSWGRRLRRWRETPKSA